MLLDDFVKSCDRKTIKQNSEFFSYLLNPNRTQFNINQLNYTFDWENDPASGGRPLTTLYKEYKRDQIKRLNSSVKDARELLSSLSFEEYHYASSILLGAEYRSEFCHNIKEILYADI